MRKMELSRKGKEFTVDYLLEYSESLPEKLELYNGRLYWSDEQRIAMLSLLLENFGVDMAVRIGDPAIWREAIDALDEAP